MTQQKPGAAANEAVVRYYDKLGSRIGYRLVMRGSKHFGYYDAAHTTEKAAQARVKEKIAEALDLQPGMRVLDAGSGLGVMAAYLAREHDVHVTGITIVPHEIKGARATARRQHAAHATEFVLADFADPPFADATFDRIYTTETLSHAPDVQKVLGQFMRLLKPGGKLICMEYEIDFANLPDGMDHTVDMTMEYGGLHGLRQFAPGMFLGKLRRAGFTDIAEHDWTPNVLPSFQRLRRLARPLARMAQHRALRKRLFNTLVAGYYADLAEDGKFWMKTYTATKPPIKASARTSSGRRRRA